MFAKNQYHDHSQYFPSYLFLYELGEMLQLGTNIVNLPLILTGIFFFNMVQSIRFTSLHVTFVNDVP